MEPSLKYALRYNSKERFDTLMYEYSIQITSCGINFPKFHNFDFNDIEFI